MLTRRQFKKLFFLSLLFSGVKSCTHSKKTDERVNSATSQELFILWERGYLSEENQGIMQIVAGWQRYTGQKVNLKLVSDDFIEQTLWETLTNPNNGKEPDIVFSITFNKIIAPLLAWEDKLLDLSEVIEPIASNFQADVLTQVLYQNRVQGDRSYYALPIGQSDAYIHYWQDSLAEIGYEESDIPQEWHEFWQFWQTAQTKLRSRQYPNIYGLGLCMSASGFDTAAAFQLFLDAHNVAIANHQDGLVIVETQNRERFTEAIAEFTNLYRQGYIPANALDWSGSGNNIAFLNRQVLMTVNMTLSIPRTQKLENNQYNQSARQRYQDIGTLITYPKTMNGTTLQVPRVLNQILAIKQERKSQNTIDFLRYLLQPDNLQRLIQGFNGRILPTMTQLLKDPMWQEPADPHSAAALAIYNQSRLPEYDKLHPVWSQIYTQQLWSQIIHRVILTNASPKQAADWGIEQIANFWQKYEKKP
ncbi:MULTISPECIES: ABC transporter substrate-binding protein [unclassified Calothrix]|uniref:ABC transporter substrate-binding protein n=1 Tax=unclassified Calothrix TaxID=2619626 RepID=UPI001687F2F7|nr:MULTISPECIES: ABC transporter substrate-binding protein [unclassified Calothrix]MBD2204717.1 carbohydrate ABC transporter substrate-binding protein [Calothrix sp. FACHB-168]